MRGSFAGSSAFAVDVSDVKELAQDFGGPEADRIVMDELRKAGHDSGQIVKKRATTFIKSQTGRLAQSAVITTKVSARSITTEVEWRARSSRGFAYSGTVHDGRGPVVAKRAKALHFFIDGQEFFRKRVGPAKGTKFADRGLAAAEAEIVARHQRAADQVAVRLERM